MHCQGTEWLHVYFILRLPLVRKFKLYYGVRFLSFSTGFLFLICLEFGKEDELLKHLLLICFPEDKMKLLPTKEKKGGRI